MSKSGFLFLLYSIFLVAGCILSLLPERTRVRQLIRALTTILVIPFALCVLGVAFFAGVMSLMKPPSLSSLASQFPARKADLQTIVRMSDEDSHYSRIAMTFLDRDEQSRHVGRYMEGDSNAGLAKSRWDAYRTIYGRQEIKLGVQRDEAGDAFIMVDSFWLLNRGHTTGYLFCRQSQAVSFRFQPCTLNKNEGSHQFDPRTRDEGYSFWRLDSSWFVYDEGPS